MIDSYISIIQKKIEEINTHEKDKLMKAAEYIYNSLTNSKGMLHLFGTGHSSILAQDLVYRAGGLVPVNIISNPSITLEYNPIISCKLEKLSGLSELILSGANVAEGEAIIIISTSGCNAVPVEMAKACKKKGMFVIGLTSKEYSLHIKNSRNIEESLLDIADITIDNKVEIGDCCLNDGINKYGSMSTVLGSIILNSIIVEVFNNYIKNGQELPVYASNNIENGYEHNKQMVSSYSERLNYKL